MIETFQTVTFLLVIGLAVWQDMKSRKIKNEVNVAGVLLGILFAVVMPKKSIGTALLGVAVLFLCGLVLWNLHVFRAGDAKLLCVAGSFLGWKLGISCLLLSILTGAMLGLPVVLYVRLIKKKKERVKFPFSIAVAIACMLTVRFGAIWDWIG